MPPLSDTIITSREIYDAVVRLTGKVDVLIEQQNHTNTDVVDHENRIRQLEKARWPLPALSIVFAIIAIAIPILQHFAGN